MKHLPLILFILAVLAAAFGYYGLHTVGGRKRFDEMAGILPAASLFVLAPTLLLAAIITLFLKLRH